MNILQESLVFPKHPELKKCEALISLIQTEMQDYTYDRIKVGEYLTEMEEILSKLFGFYGMSISINNLMSVVQNTRKVPNHKTGEIETQFVIPNLDIVNAFTYKSDLFHLKNLLFETSSDTYEIKDNHIQFKKNIKPYCTVTLYPSLFQMKGVTPSEIMSIILHEIGHNFYRGSFISRAFAVLAVPFQALMILQMVIFDKIAGLLSIGAKSEILRFIFNFTYTSLESIITEISSLYKNGTFSNRTQSKLQDSFISNISSATKLIIDTINFGLNLALLPFRLIFDTIANLRSDMLTEEKFSDEFAAMHGYGPDIASILTKMTMPTIFGNLEEKKRKEAYTDSYLLLALHHSMIMSLAHFTDTHPENISSRPVFIKEFYINQLKYAKNEKEKNFIHEQIKALENSNFYLMYSKEAKLDNKKFVEKYGKHYDDIFDGQASFVDRAKESIANFLGINKFNSEYLAKELEEGKE